MIGNDIAVGVIGVGNIGTVHLQSARAIEGIRVAAVADTDPDMRARARKLGVPVAYSDYGKLLEQEDLDAVVVALPPSLHADAVVRAAEEGCHAFVEKPFAPALAEADRMVDATDRAGVFVGVDHTIRYQPEIRRLKEEYETGALGHVPLCVISRVNNGPFSPPPADAPVAEWQIDSEVEGYGAVLDLGVHLFDVLEWFFGEMELSHARMDRQLDLPYEDTASIQLESRETGTFATLNCGFFQWEEPPDVNMHLRLDGVAKSVESGEYVPENFPVYAARSAVENVSRRLQGETPEFFKPTYYYRAHYGALEAFLSAIREGRAPPVTGEDGRRTIELAERAYEMADRDRPEERPKPQPSNES